MLLENIRGNEFGKMLGEFESKRFGYKMEVMYEKDVPESYIRKIVHYFENLNDSVIKKNVRILCKIF